MAKNKQNYSISEKIEYHKKRVNAPGIKENQRIYSQNWLNGFKNEDAKTNLKGSQHEFENNKKLIFEYEKKIKKEKREIKNIRLANRIMYTPYIYGLQARLKETK